MYIHVKTNGFVYLICVCCSTQEYSPYTTAASIMVGGKPGQYPEGNHPQVSGRPLHIQLKRTSWT